MTWYGVCNEGIGVVEGRLGGGGEDIIILVIIIILIILIILIVIIVCRGVWAGWDGDMETTALWGRCGSVDRRE